MIDAQVAEGTLTEAEAQTHPDRNQLTSVIMGGRDTQGRLSGRTALDP